MGRTWVEGRLECVTTGTGFGSQRRDHLDGQPISSCTLLELETITGWEVVRYETHMRVVYLHATEDRVLRHVNGVRLRWPRG